MQHFTPMCLHTVSHWYLILLIILFQPLSVWSLLPVLLPNPDSFALFSPSPAICPGSAALCKGSPGSPVFSVCCSDSVAFCIHSESYQLCSLPSLSCSPSLSSSLYTLPCSLWWLSFSLQSLSCLLCNLFCSVLSLSQHLLLGAHCTASPACSPVSSAHSSGKFACGVIDTGGAPWLATISANFWKNSKWSYCYYQGLGGRWLMKKPEAKNLVTLSL